MSVENTVNIMNQNKVSEILLYSCLLNLNSCPNWKYQEEEMLLENPTVVHKLLSIHFFHWNIFPNLLTS